VSENDEHSTGDEVSSPEEQRVRALLRGAGDLGPMPDDVVARLDAALAAARSDTPVASLAAHRRPRWPRLLAAAAGIVVLGGGALWAAQEHTPSGSSSSTGGAGSVAAAAAEEVPPTAKLLLSGKDYTDAAAVQDLAEDTLVDGAGQDTSAAAPEATPGTSATDDKTLLMAPQDDESATSDPAQRPAAERVLACTKSLGVDPDSVLAVEIASWRTVPAALVVHRTDAGAEVVVVALDCTPGDAAYSRVDVPLPSGS
jgi:hypothetical protein